MTTTARIVPAQARGVRAAYARLADAQKGHARGAPAYSVYVNRRIGRFLAAVAFDRGISPNQATAISAAHTFSGILLLVLLEPSWWASVIISGLLVLGYAWDSADGQIARLRGGGTAAGEWLDHFVDAVKIATLHVAVLIGFWLHTPFRETGWMLVPLLFSVVSTVAFFGTLLNDLLKATRGAPSTHRRGGGTAVRSLMLLPTDFGVVCLCFLLWWWSSAFLVLYSALAAAATAFLVLAATKWFREMAKL